MLCHIALATALAAPSAHAAQRDIPRIKLMPNTPQPFEMRDWQATAEAYNEFVFDLEAKGEFLPLVWLDESGVNFDGPTFGLPSYVGDARLTGRNHEGITAMGAVLGASVAGLPTSRGTHDWAPMCRHYFNVDTGERLALNYTEGDTGGSFWYEILPNILFLALNDRAVQGAFDEKARIIADRWREAVQAMGGGTPELSFDYTAFDFDEMEPVANGQWTEPDAAAGIAWLEYSAWKRFGDSDHLQTAEWCLTWLHDRRDNPYYESLLPWGALTAARVNAERGAWYDVDKLLNWCFEPTSTCRPGWGVIADRWGEYDCHGLLGSTTGDGGYAFAMNSFVQAGALVPVARYDDRYARAIGKWMLNAANAARLFYPDAHPTDRQSSSFWKGDPDSVIAYEGLRKWWEGTGPYATGDPLRLEWGPKTDLGLYGSSYVGFFGGIIARTNHEHILQLDCLPTDFYRDKAYPTYLYYNPYREPKAVRLDVGPEPTDFYDAATDTFVRRNARGKTSFRLAADSAAVIVLAPASGEVTREGMRTLVDGVVIDYVTATPWTPELIGDTNAWYIHMNEAIVNGTERGLRIEVAPGNTWGIASVPEVLLPEGARDLRVRVSDLGGGATWMMKLLGDTNGDGRSDGRYEAWLPLWKGSTQRRLSTPVHPSLLADAETPLIRVELVVEGPPGAYVEFSAVEVVE